MEVQKDNGPKQHSLLNKALIELKNKKDKISEEYSEKITELQTQHQLSFIKKNFEKLSTSIRYSEFSVRTLNCLLNLSIKDIGDLIQLSEKYLLSSPNFGRKSLEEIKEKLQSMNLKLNTKIHWPLYREDLESIKENDLKEYSEKIAAVQKQYELNFIKENFEKLSTPIKNLGLSIRTVNCLVNLEIKDVGELLQFPENYLLRHQNFGRKSLKEIENLLASFDLNFNTKIKWPPENYADLIKKLNNSIVVADSKSKKFKRIEIDENSLNKEFLMDTIKSSLKEREYLVLRKRFWEGQTLEEIGQIEKVTRERIRQIEAKSLKKIRRNKLIFSKFLELKKDEIFSEYSSTANLVTDESLSKVKKKYPLNEYDGLIFLCFEAIGGDKYDRSFLQIKRNFFNIYFNSLKGGWYKKNNIIDLDDNTEELIYYLDKKPLPRQCESGRELSNISKENFKDAARLAVSRSDYYILNNYLCKNSHSFSFISNKYLVQMHEVLFNASPNTLIKNNDVMRLIKKDRFLNDCPYSNTIFRAKELMRGKGFINTDHLFYVTGTGIIPLGLEDNNHFKNLESSRPANEDISSEEQSKISEKLEKYLKIIEGILKEYKAISLNRLSEIYVTKIDQKIKPRQAWRVLGILLSSYEKFVQIGPGVWSLKNIPNPAQNLADFVIKDKNSYPVDMYCLIKYAGEDVAVYPGCNKDFEREICVKGKEIFEKKTYQSLIYISDPKKWTADNNVIKEFEELKKFSNFFLNIKASGTFNIGDKKKIKSYDIDNLGIAILHIFDQEQTSIIGLNQFFDYSLFWNTSVSILILLSYAGLIEVPKNSLKPYKINKSKIIELRRLVLREFIENGYLSWNRDFGKKIIELIESNYTNFINMDNWITEDLRLHDKI